MFDKKYQWYRLAPDVETLQIKDKDIQVAEINGKRICLALHNDRLYAFAYKCPHASGIMANGCIDTLGNVVCPLHRYKFSMENGRNTSGEGYYLKTYPIEIREDGIYIGLMN
ncbi:MAG: Rieske (2Fe-2S) protein [Sphingobacteriales bacterium]|jgi:nitrite reductase/ring-hydroxylating ferredoxin subunit